MFTEKKHALEFILTFSSFIPLEHKFVLVYTLLHRCFCLVFDMSNFHFEIENLNKILLSNGYSNTFIDKCLSKFMDKLYVKKPVIETIPKKQLYLLLPLKGKMSALVNSGSARLLHKRLPFCKVKIAFKNSNSLENYFSIQMLFLNLCVLATFMIYVQKLQCFIYW